MRKNNRPATSLRPLTFTPKYIRQVPGSALVEMGDTRVVCTASIEEKVPHFLKNTGKGGWITAEYGMLPGSCGQQRLGRERQKSNHRHTEIQRFIGRALRTVLPMKSIGDRNITLDCDVIQADGSTRCASVNGALVALLFALKYMVFEHKIPHFPQIQWLAAVSLGIKDEEVLLDLDYDEDSTIDADINVISDQSGRIVEVQAFAEGRTVPVELFNRAIALGVEKNHEIIATMKKTVQEAGLVF